LSRALFRPLFLSLGFVLLAAGAARADTPIQQDCLEADPRYSAEACAVALRGNTEPNDIFRFQAAAGSAELARGRSDYALIDFQDAFDAVKKGAAPAQEQYADVLAVSAIAHLRDNDPASALAALDEARKTDARNGRVPLLTAYAHFAAADPASAAKDLDVLIKASPGDTSLTALKAMFEQWQVDPDAAVAECQKNYGAECGSAALGLHENDKAASDLVSSILGKILQGDVPRMSRETAAGAWSDCEAPEPQYAGPGCDQILGGDITPEERYAASINRILAALHNDDAGQAIDDGERLLGRLEYGAAKSPENDPTATAAHAVLIQAHLARGDIDAASAAADAAIANSPDEPTFLALRALVDLALGKIDDAGANLDLAKMSATEESADITNLAAVVDDMGQDLAAGVAHCQQVYAGAGCGSEELAAGDEAGALRKAATDISAVFAGNAERRFTLIGVDTLP
jgi:tetratricopeptide (TPR) repeat protein